MNSAAKAGRDVGFRPSEDDVGGDEKKNSDDGQAEQIATRDGDAMSAEGAEAKHEQACGGEAKRSHQQRGEVLNRDAYGKVGGAPEDVNQCKGDDDVQPSGRVGSHGIEFNFISFGARHR